MHDIEPYFNWLPLYSAAEDERSPFYGRIYNEFEFENKVYNYLIHPQWDSFGSQTIYLKVLFCDYVDGFAVIEIMGEWNDALYNDIMMLKRELLEPMMDEGISKFILIGENVLNFHASDDAYYEEWWQEVDEQDGWICLLNFREHILSEMNQNGIGYYLVWGGDLDDLEWRKHSPRMLLEQVTSIMSKRLG